MSEKKNPQQVISPEEIELNRDYTITLAPNDVGQHWGTHNRIETCKIQMSSLIQYFHKDIDYLIYMEVSRTGRLHWHGTINFKSYESIVDFYVDRIHNLQNHMLIEIDSIKDTEKWQLYCTKSQKMKFPKLTPKIVKELLKEATLEVGTKGFKNKRFSEFK